MKHVALALFGIALLLSAPLRLAAQDAAGTVDESLLAKLQGEWRMQSMVANGKPVERDFENDSAPMVIRGRNVGNQVGKPGTETIQHLQLVDGFIHLDIVSEGEPGVQRWLGKLDKDTLTICLVPGGDARPDDLSSKPGSNRLMSVNKRAKKGAAAPTEKSKNAGLRTWESTAGTTVSAFFVEVDGDVVVLKKTNGDLIRVPLEKLSEGDRKWIRDQGK